jgi:hypothetical protein
MKLFSKDPNAVLDYEIDWTDWLTGGETISTATWTVSSGITKDSESNSTTKAKVWLSGGTAGTTYTATNRITTNSTPARTDERTIEIRVEQR